MNKYFVNGFGIWAEHDRFIQEVLVNNEYESLWRYDTVVDLGANIGTFSLWIYPFATKIFAVEPNPKPMQLLQKTIEDNNIEKIIPVEVAIAGSDGKRFMSNTEDEHKQYGSGVINDKKGITVKGQAIDTFMIKQNIDYIDLLKIDVEGSEQEIFESKGFSSVSNKIGTIIGEYHSGDTQSKISALLSGYGFNYLDLTKANSSGKFIARKA